MTFRVVTWLADPPPIATPMAKRATSPFITVDPLVLRKVIPLALAVMVGVPGAGLSGPSTRWPLRSTVMPLAPMTRPVARARPYIGDELGVRREHRAACRWWGSRCGGTAAAAASVNKTTAGTATRTL
ncbi:MAG: hypothetical protein M3137_19845 [Actinomycetota bacterium]|nr:hypothetical protein [Actinomycetota bacterium]